LYNESETNTNTNTETVDDDKAAEAAFSQGFDEVKPAPSHHAKAPPATTSREEPKEKPEPGPEYVQITKADWDMVNAAAKKTASYDQQLSKAFGTIGNLQKVINGLQSQTPQGRKVEISADAFKDLERDFPELAKSTRTALERALSGVTGTGQDPAAVKKLLDERTAEREIEVLEDAYPDWRDIVGAVDVTREMPDPNNAFRKWLGTKDAAYQRRVNATDSAAVITRAINTFQRETKAQASKTAAPVDNRANATRTSRIAAAVQPRGDGAAPTMSGANTEEEAFAAGYNSR
jgi:hypothetical protein